MLLNNPMVNHFEYKGKEYNIDLSFDNVLDVFDVLEDNMLRENEKAEISLQLLLDEENKDVDLWNYIYDNYIKFEDKRPIEYDIKGNPMPSMEDSEEKKVIDLKEDSEYIFASFMQAYKIDLYESQGVLHWHKFKALLNGLPTDTIMQRIIQIRSWKPSKGESKEYKESMREMQRVYKLDNSEQHNHYMTPK